MDKEFDDDGLGHVLKHLNSNLFMNSYYHMAEFWEFSIGT